MAFVEDIDLSTRLHKSLEITNALIAVHVTSQLTTGRDREIAEFR